MAGLSGLIEHVDRAFEVWTFQKTAHSTSKHIKYEQAPGKEHTKMYLNLVKGVVLVTQNHASLTLKLTPRQQSLHLNTPSPFPHMLHAVCPRKSPHPSCRSSLRQESRKPIHSINLVWVEMRRNLRTGERNSPHFYYFFHGAALRRCFQKHKAGDRKWGQTQWGQFEAQTDWLRPQDQQDVTLPVAGTHSPLFIDLYILCSASVLSHLICSKMATQRLTGDKHETQRLL